MTNTDDELRPEYDVAAMTNGVRGKYAARFAAGTNLVRIDPDLAAEFVDERAINDVLRWVLTLPGAVERLAKRSG